MSLVSAVIVVCVLMAWVVPLAVGIKLLRGPARGGGIVLIVLSVLWAVPAVTGLVLGCLYWSDLSRSYFETKDFNAASYSGPLGVVRLPYRGTATLVTKQPNVDDAYRYRTSDGNFRLPVGKHTVESYSLEAVDETGARWRTEGSDGERTLTVRSDQPVDLAVGAPFQARVTVEDDGKTMTLSLALTDSAGQSVSFSRNNEPVPPRFEVVDTLGTVRFQGEFAYG